MTATPPTTSATPEPPNVLVQLGRLIWRTNMLFGILGFIGVVASAMRTTSGAYFATALAWMLASLVAGASVGFLFGVPKILQGDSARAAGVDPESADRMGYRQQVNTNLTEISDWLTKIIVGLGLINLEKLPTQLLRIGKVVAAGLAGKAGTGDTAFAIGLIVGYVTIGFLYGYISTRLLLAGAFSEADQAALRNLSEQRYQIATNQTAIASLNSSTELLKQVVFPQRAEPAADGNDMQLDMRDVRAEKKAKDQKAEEDLLTLAKKYMAIQIKDYAARVKAKDDAANRMASLIVNAQLSTDALVDLYRREPNEGVVVALATAINLQPSPGDFAKLLSISSGITRLHVWYRVLVALGELARRGMAVKEDLPRLLSLLDEYQKGADRSLTDQIAATRSIVERILRPDS